MFPKCSKILKYNAVFNVKVANGQGLRRMEVLAGEKAYKCVYQQGKLRAYNSETIMS